MFREYVLHDSPVEREERQARIRAETENRRLLNADLLSLQELSSLMERVRATRGTRMEVAESVTSLQSTLDALTKGYQNRKEQAAREKRLNDSLATTKQEIAKSEACLKTLYKTMQPIARPQSYAKTIKSKEKYRNLRNLLVDSLKATCATHSTIETLYHSYTTRNIPQKTRCLDLFGSQLKECDRLFKSLETATNDVTTTESYTSGLGDWIRYLLNEVVPISTIKGKPDERGRKKSLQRGRGPRGESTSEHLHRCDFEEGASS